MRDEIYWCELCGKEFKSAAKKHSKFCSDACKQKDYRRRNGACNKREGAKKAAATKALQLHQKTCKHCRRGFSVDGNSVGNTLYCSDACKQAAYRERCIEKEDALWEWVSGATYRHKLTGEIYIANSVWHSPNL